MRFRTQTITYILSLIFALSFSHLFADNVDNTTVITGIVQNTGDIEHSPKKYLKIELYTPHLSSQVVYKNIVMKDSSFQISLDISEPQVVALKYLRRKVYMYVEPFDTLQVSLDADDFPASLAFSSKAGINNKIFTDFSTKFPEEKNQFKMMQYRKGTVYYKVGVDLDSDMRRKSPEDFRKQIDTERDEKIAAYKAYKEKYGRPSEDFELYMWSEINYGWALTLLTYGHAHGYYNKVTPEFFFFVHDVPLMNAKAMGNPKYRKYIKAYINYTCMDKYPEDDIFFKQLEIAEKEGLKDEAMAYFKSTLIVRALKKHDNQDEVIPYYQDFLNTNKYEKYDKIVMETYEGVNRYAAGQYASNYTLKDVAGNNVSLNEFRGKTIYMDFWASWCRPCVQKLDEMQTIKDKLAENENIVFIHISFDNQSNEWTEKINEKGFSGIHLQAAEGTKSKVAQLYNIKALPEYFIITPQGTYAQKPIRFNVDEIQDILERLDKKVAADKRD
ncbi:MAG: TlpA family protein disulfide reductase [Saprospiraceae bacterium]